jgi:hypothetical protein
MIVWFSVESFQLFSRSFTGLVPADGRTNSINFQQTQQSLHDINFINIYLHYFFFSHGVTLFNQLWTNAFDSYDTNLVTCKLTQRMSASICNKTSDFFVLILERGTRTHVLLAWWLRSDFSRCRELRDATLKYRTDFIDLIGYQSTVNPWVKNSTALHHPFLLECSIWRSVPKKQRKFSSS